MASIRIRAAIACDDVRQEMSGKLTVVGASSPQLSYRASPAGGVHRMRKTFLLAVDFPAEGKYDLAFRARSLANRKGQTIRMTVSVTDAAEQVPMPIGPFVVPLAEADEGFVLQQEVGGRWRTIATWQTLRKTDAPSG